MRLTKGIVLAAAALVLTSGHVGAAPPPPGSRAFSAGRFALELDGIVVGIVSNMEGGNIVGEVVKEPPGEDPFIKKHLANVGYRDIVLEFGTGMSRPLFDWIKASLQRQYSPKSGAVLALDFQNTVQSRLEFTQAQITEVTFPAADASSKETGKFSIRLTPMTTTLNRKAGGKVGLGVKTSQKTLLESNFRLAIQGLNLQKASKIEQLTVKLPPLNDPSGVCFRCEITPVAPPDFPHVIVTLAEVDAGPVYQWLDDFVLNGNNEDAAEKEGTLEYLTPNLGATLFELTFKHLGIFEVAPAPASAADSIAKVLIAMYCEQIVFDHFITAN